MSDDTRVQVARLVAEHWRRESWNEGGGNGPVTAGIIYSMTLVLAALDGETDPDQLGVAPSVERDAIEALGAAHALLEEEQ